MSAPTPDITDLLPPSLNLPPHLSAHKYFFVCTLTVAAWDTLVLSPRTWRLFRSKEWPLLKIIFHFLRLFMPVEFTIVAVAFFDTKFTSSQCDHFYLFEPICTAILISVCSLVHLVRINAIYAGNKLVQLVLGFFLVAQVIIMAVLCGFYRPMPLVFPAPPSNSGQGCIAGPKFNDRQVVGLYWLLPTVFYTCTFALALGRSLNSLQVKQLSYWKLMLRDGLNLYGAIWVVNMVNMLFWFIATPTDNADTIKTIVSSMAAVLTTTMTLRIILSIRGPLAHGGTFNGSASSASSGAHHGAGSHSGLSGSRSGTQGGPQILSHRGVGSHPGGGGVIAIHPTRGGANAHGQGAAHTYTIGADGKEEARWAADGDDKSQSSVPYKEGGIGGLGEDPPPPDGRYLHHAHGGQHHGLSGVKVTIDRHVDDGGGGYAR